MKKCSLFLYAFCVIFLGTVAQSYGNDGVFYARGNQLIPIIETDIRVQKEILTLKKVAHERIEVSVYYEFYNPKQAKDLLVGFEAASPEGDVDGRPIKGMHPHMRNFLVEMNGKNLPFKVDYVADSNYVKAGVIQKVDLQKFDGNTEGNYVDFFYVYNFIARFKPGLNIIKHTYSYDISGSIDMNFIFDYVLTAANRWGNKQIDDFTLILDMGPFETFHINNSFFNAASDWKIQGIAKTNKLPKAKNIIMNTEATTFHLKEGKLLFHKKNFRPAGELEVYNFQNHITLGNEEAGLDVDLPYSIYQQPYLDKEEKLTAQKKRILANLPFARRGYVFQDKTLKEYYERMPWYIPNPAYSPDRGGLLPLEKQWLKELAEMP